MKIAVIGSRGLEIDDLGKYLPEDTTEIILGGSESINRCTKRYARKRRIKLIKPLPDNKFFAGADHADRETQIVEYADLVIAFWDGRSKGTKGLIDLCNEMEVKVKVYIAEPY